MGLKKGAWGSTRIGEDSQTLGRAHELRKMDKRTIFEPKNVAIEGAESLRSRILGQKATFGRFQPICEHDLDNAFKRA